MRVVLTGANGQLGAYLWRRLEVGGHVVHAWGGTRPADRLQLVDLRDPEATARAMEEADPDVILHAAAISSAEQVRRDPEGGRAVNVDATVRLARWCRLHGRRMIYTSTDLVFDGSRAWNHEDDPAVPTLSYGKTKLDAEPHVLAVPGCLVARISLLYGPSRSGLPTYMDRTINAWTRGEPQTFFEDEYRTPLDLASAADALVGLLEIRATGLVHVGGLERLSRFGLAKRVASALGFAPDLVLANRQADVASPEPRPADVSLDTRRFRSLLPEHRRTTVEGAVSEMWGSSNSETAKGPAR